MKKSNANASRISEQYSLTEDEAAHYLGLRSGQTLYLWRKRGEGPPFIPYKRSRLFRTGCAI